MAERDLLLLAMVTQAKSQIGTLSQIVTKNASWDDIKTVVQSGLAPSAFPVGTQFTASHSTYGDLVFDVVGHDHHQKADSPAAHTMTLMMHNVISSKMYSAPEALYFVSAEVFPGGMSAGTYHFNIPGSLRYHAQLEGWDGIQIVLTSAVPVGGQIAATWTDGNVSGAKFSTRAAAADTTNIESNIAPTNGTGGTSLGEIANIGAEYDGIHNFWMFARRGNNSWKESNLRQWANSDDEAFSFVPQNVFDRITGYNLAGFIYGFDNDFKSALCPAKIKTCTNVVFAPIPESGAELVETVDTFFPASWTEILGTAQSGIRDEKVFPFYSGATASQRVKYRADATTTAAQYALRSNQPQYTYNAVAITSAGATSGFYPYSSSTLSFCCVVG